jgi:hypothetical protein
MKQIFLILIILIGFSNVANAKAKMLKTPEGSWINEDVIYEIAPLNNGGCKIYYTVGGGSRNYSVSENCEEFIKRMDIETKE